MDVTKLNIKTVKIVYIAVAMLMAIGAIICAFYDQKYLGVALAIGASIVIVAGSFLVAFMFRHQKFRDL